MRRARPTTDATSAIRPDGQPGSDTEMLAVGDLGIRRAFMNNYGFDHLPSPDEMEPVAEPWRPYRTIACMYLWRSLDNTPA